jgi:hypothetical protein
MKAIPLVLALLLGGAALHFLALWLERRGWLYYKHRKSSSTRLGNAFLEIQSILEPNKRHIIAVRDEMKRESEQPGDEPGEGDGKGGGR